MDEGLANLVTILESRTSDEAPWRPDIDAYEPSLQAAVDAATRYIADMVAGAEPYWLTLSGDPGTGKTMLARQIFEQSKRHNPGRHSLWVPPSQATGVLRDSDRRPYCIWLDATKFAERLKSGEYDLPESLRPDWVVAFDDLGASRDKTDFVPEAIYRLATGRLGKWMLWTTNLTPAEIASRLDARITSRLLRDDNKLVTLKCRDYALRGK